MSGNNPNLKELLARLRKSAGLAPPTPAEADKAMGGSEEAQIDDQRILDIADAVVRGKPMDIVSPEPAAWSEEVLSESDRNEFVLNRNPGGGNVNEETQERIDAAERKALVGKESTMSKLRWKAMATRIERACQAADEISGHMETPIDPLDIANGEGQALLRYSGDDFGDAFDGQLKYHREQGCFLLLFNTKYDRGRTEGHHPRTRFSIAHELGHYFLEKHRAYLMEGGDSHPSRSEFTKDSVVEREADAFAAALLMPSSIARPLVNEADLSLSTICELRDRFNLSLVSTTLRAIQLSDYHCAAVGLQNGRVAWSFLSQSLKEAGFYPPEKAPPKSKASLTQWRAFQAGADVASGASAFSGQWFRTYDKHHLKKLHVDEHYIPVPSMGTLVVLLTIPEDELLDIDGDF